MASENSAVIRSNAEMEELSKGESKWMQSTIRQVDRMNGLIKNLVMITKSREIESKAAASKINVSDIVAETAKEFSAMTEKEGKILCFVIPCIFVCSLKTLQEKMY